MAEQKATAKTETELCPRRQRSRHKSTIVVFRLTNTCPRGMPPLRPLLPHRTLQPTRSLKSFAQVDCDILPSPGFEDSGIQGFGDSL